MYICKICNTPFDEPMRESDGVELCPVCLAPHITEAARCERCGAYRQMSESLCHNCRVKLLKRFTDFCDTLTAEEEQQLDDWMDGDSITNRRKWGA